MLRLVKFDEYYGRQGTLEGLFVTDEEDWNNIQILIKSKKEILFYEALGKHSQPRTALTDKNITVMSDDQDFIKKFAEIMGSHVSGINPLNNAEDLLWEISQEEDGLDE